MKRWIVGAMVAAALGLALLWAATEVEHSRKELPSLMPDGALLYLESKDFRALLKGWNDSPEKRTWLKGDDYQAFSRSRLFDRLSQAQAEFSAAAEISTDGNLLSSIAGTQSALGLYDIGNLEFVYVTRMDDSAVQATPLWQVRAKFEQRTEGSVQFFEHRDTQSNRTAVFAASQGWLIIGTREDLVAGVIDRIQGAATHSLSDEAWYADTITKAHAPVDDLRMVLNLDKIVPSPYFRSYWVQRNVTDMKQYRAALCDLHRSADTFREDRVLLRKPNLSAAATGDVRSLAALVPADAVFYSAQASPSPDHLLTELRENLLELKASQARASWFAAPPAAAPENAGSASMLEERIDVAPVIIAHADPFQPLRTLLTSAQPATLLEVYETRSPEDGVFVHMDRAMVVDSALPWDVNAMKAALTTALRPALTASQLGVGWETHSGAAGEIFALNGRVPLYLAARGDRLFLATNATLLDDLLSRAGKTAESRGITYAAVFQHSAREETNFRSVVDRLDRVGSSKSATVNVDNQEVGEPAGQAPPFFSGNVASLSSMFANVARESIEESDQGAQVTQTVIYQWQRP